MTMSEEWHAVMAFPMARGLFVVVVIALGAIVLLSMTLALTMRRLHRSNNILDRIYSAQHKAE